MTTDEGKDVILSGWRAAGITKTLENGSDSLESLDPFHDIDPLVEAASVTQDDNHLVNIGEDHFIMTDSDSDSDESEWEHQDRIEG